MPGFNVGIRSYDDSNFTDIIIKYVEYAKKDKTTEHIYVEEITSSETKTYKQLTLDEILDHVQNELFEKPENGFDKLSKEKKEQLSAALKTMGENKQKKAYGWANFIGGNFFFLREIFAALGNLIFGHHRLETSASRALSLSERISPTSTPSTSGDKAAASVFRSHQDASSRERKDM